MNKEKRKPAHESLLEGLEALIEDIGNDSPFTVDQGSLATAIETVMMMMVEIKIPEKHLKEVVDRLRALGGEGEEAVGGTPLVCLALLGLAWKLEQPDEEEEEPAPDPAE